MGEIYQCVCHTCEEEAVLEDLDRAQAFFGEHAERGCEVVLQNVSSSHSPTGSTPEPSNDTSDESPETDE